MMINGRRSLRAALVAVVVGIIVGCSIPAAYAYSDAHSATGSYGPYSGYKYNDRANIYTNTPQPSGTTVWGVEEIWTVPQYTVVPTGYMGVSPRVYTASGSLVASAGYAYNTASAYYFQNTCGYWAAPSGYYKSQGLTQVWDTGTNMYRTHWTQTTPNCLES